MQSISTAIIGNGCAAVECVRAMRETGYRRDIHVFAAGDLPVYNPMLTSYYAAGKIDYGTMFPYGPNAFGPYDAALHPNCPVTCLDAVGRRLETASGERYTFDQCLIATGASAFVPPFPGSDLPQVHTMRTVEDAVRLKSAMDAAPKRALVVGASMVGIKLVELFQKAGVEVVLADMAAHIFPLAAHPDCARVIEQRLRKQGVQLLFGAAIQRAEQTANGVAAHFKDMPAPVEADLLLMCIGVRANLGFVESTQLEKAQGILVNTQMRGSLPHIYAAGDAAQGYNLLTGKQQVIGLWANARNQGRTAGVNMGGGKREYAGEILHNITHFMGMDFVGIGDVAEYDHTERLETSHTYAQLFYRDGLLTGANFVDRFAESGVLKNALLKRLHGVSSVACTGTVPLQNHLLHSLVQDIRSAS